MTNYQAMKSDIARLLAQERALGVFFTTMIDLYALPADFPGINETKTLRHAPYERVRKIEEAFATDIGDRRFLPFIQLHEFEAYLFSNPACFASRYPTRSKQVAELKRMADLFEAPEFIDDGPTTAPSKRILAQFPDYVKHVDGLLVAQDIGLDVIRSKCPHFDEWVRQLENL